MVGSDAFREASAWGVEITWGGTTPDGKKFLNIEEFDSIETPEILDSPRMKMALDVIRTMKNLCGGSLPILGWIEAPFAELCSMFGIINIMKLLRKPKGPEIIASLLDRILAVQLEFEKMQIEVGADFIGSGDAYQNEYLNPFGKTKKNNIFSPDLIRPVDR